MNTRTIFYSIFLIAVIATAIYGFSSAYQKNQLTGDASFSHIDSCLYVTNEMDKSECLQRTVSGLLEKHTAGEIVEYTVATTTAQTVRNQCHPIAHIIGAKTYDKYQSIEDTLSECSGLCRSGCVHGAIGAGLAGDESHGMDMAHMDAANLSENAAHYCDMGKDVCHGVGHVAYLATFEENSALTMCDTFTTDPTKREACYQGVFMERAGNFRNMVFPSEQDRVPPTVSGDYTYPCSSIEPQYRHACYIFLNAYQEPLFLEDEISTPEQKLSKAREACESLTGFDRNYCFSGIGTFSPNFGFYDSTSVEIHNLCNQFELIDDRTSCNLGVLSQFHFAELQGVYNYCEGIDESERRKNCQNAAFEIMETKFDTATPENVCGSNENCLSDYSIFLENKSDLEHYNLGFPKQ